MMAETESADVGDKLPAVDANIDRPRTEKYMVIGKGVCILHCADLHSRIGVERRSSSHEAGCQLGTIEELPLFPAFH